MTQRVDIHYSVQDYYGKQLETSGDLKTNACCTADAYPRYIKTMIGNIHSEVVSKYYGCGLTIPTKLEGTKVLDLGSGAGRDVYIASQLVGESGYVVGVDMTKEQLDVANNHLDFHKDKFGFLNSNVEFKEGYLENLLKLGLENKSFDVIISNCVINLVKDKQVVLDSCYELLSEGGELYFSDVYASRRVPQDLQEDEVLYGECLSGALYWNDFENMAKKAGFTDPRVVESSLITIENEELSARVGDIKFYSVTYRLFKLPDLEPDCEDYGQAVKYKGTVKYQEKGFLLDGHHYFQAGKIELVCGNSWKMLQNTRFKDDFEFIGNFDTHFGIFEGCGKVAPYTGTDTKGGELGCC
ncbi:methyltransferase domain-containing protein [bacterium]|nr:methyltransferase domain-containing protein [bacterium]